MCCTVLLVLVLALLLLLLLPPPPPLLLHIFLLMMLSDHPNKHYTDFYNTQITMTTTTTATIQAHTATETAETRESLEPQIHTCIFNIPTESRVYTVLCTPYRTNSFLFIVFFFCFSVSLPLLFRCFFSRSVRSPSTAPI